MLTDKAKTLFEDWYKLEFEKRNLPYLDGFYISDLSIQIGVYEDFAESLFIYITIRYNELAKMYGYQFNFNPIRNDMCTRSIFKTKNEARKEIIKQLNILINETN